MAAAVERFGGLDIVVANAGVGAYGDFLDLDPEHLEEMVDVNVKGLLYTVRATLPRLLESDAADLVVVASIAGQRGPEGEAVYAASKFAQVGFMRALDHELWQRGVRCSTLAPGGVETEFAMGGAGARPRTPTCPASCAPEEVADAVRARAHPAPHAPDARGVPAADGRRLAELRGDSMPVKVTIDRRRLEQLRPAPDPPLHPLRGRSATPR